MGNELSNHVQERSEIMQGAVRNTVVSGAWFYHICVGNAIYMTVCNSKYIPRFINNHKGM